MATQTRRRRLPSWALILSLLIMAALGITSTACTPPRAGLGGDTTGQQITITILYTNDEHGWIASDEHRGGAAGLVRLWHEQENYSEDGAFLILGGGDLWTGPALSTWFEGEPTVDVMNAMGYEAVAIGNHEFDFGLDTLREREAEAEFAFLGANIIDSATEKTADFALPYIVKEVSGVKVGIIGLASQHTPQTTMPTHIAGLKFTDYAEALQRTVPAARADGAQVLIVISHLCSAEMQALAPTAAKLGVSMIGGGHCHEKVARVNKDIALIEAGWRMEAYGRVDLTLDPASGEIHNVAVVLKPNPPGEGDKDIEGIVASWQAQLDGALMVPIGYTKEGLRRDSPALHNLVTDAWLAAYPADIAMTNPGGFRQDIDAGEITLADIVGVLPFDNTLIDVTLTGEEVIASYNHGTRKPAVSGLTHDGEHYFVAGEPLDPNGIYHMLINDYMYAGGDGYKFAEYDPHAYQTSIDWRQPVIAWISSRHTTPADPLENYLDFEPR